MSWNAISIWIKSTVNHAYGSSFKANCKTNKVRENGTSIFFMRSCAFQQVLKALFSPHRQHWLSFTWEMSPIGTWTPSPLVLSWQLKRLSSSLALKAALLVTFIQSFLWWYVIESIECVYVPFSSLFFHPLTKSFRNHTHSIPDKYTAWTPCYW